MRCLGSLVGDIAGDVLSPAGLDRLRAVDPHRLPRVEGSPRIGPCVGAVSKIIGVGLNYHDHARVAGVRPPGRPVFFFKPPSSLCGPYDAVVRPKGSTHLDWEVELAVVISTTTRYVEPEAAAERIAGFCILNDITERKWIETSGQMLDGKSADTFSPLGPWLVTPDEIQDPQNLTLELSVNGVRRQHGNTADMVFGVAELISRLSHIMTLEPGDIITTGTPAGVGMRMTPPVYLQPGDCMTLRISGLGEQRQTVVSAEEPA